MARRPLKAAVDITLVLKQPTKLAAINLCIQLSGLEDKEIYSELGIDAGQWSRIRKGDAHFPTNKESELMRICGNIAPLIWSAAHEGYELRPVKSELEAQVEDLTRKLEAKDLELKTITDFVKNTGSRA